MEFVVLLGFLGFALVIWTERARTSRFYEAQRRNEEQVRGWAERQFKFMLDAQHKQSKVLTETVDRIVSSQEGAINEAQMRANEVAQAIFRAEQDAELEEMARANGDQGPLIDEDFRIDDMLGS